MTCSRYPKVASSCTTCCSISTGGFREPAIVRYPPMVQAGQRLSQLASTMDIFPTALELAGVKPPEGRPLDGRSLLMGSAETTRGEIAKFSAADAEAYGRYEAEMEKFADIVK